VIIVGDEPLKLKAGDAAAARYPADKKLELLKAAMTPKLPVQK
jgi:hypothetical protein